MPNKVNRREQSLSATRGKIDGVSLKTTFPTSKEGVNGDTLIRNITGKGVVEMKKYNNRWYGTILDPVENL